MLIGLVSAKGSPGVTTTALALCATHPSGLADTSPVFCEFDPSGGDVECWSGRTAEPGLLRVIGDLRRSRDANVLVAHGVGTPPRMQSILAPADRGEATATILAAMELRLGAVWQAADRLVCLDGGRWAHDQPGAGRLEGCDLLAVVCPSTVAGVHHAAGLVRDLRARFDFPVTLIMVGSGDFSSVEIASTVGVPVAGGIAWDPRGVRILLSSGATRAWARSTLARSARGLSDRLVALASQEADAGLSADGRDTFRVVSGA